MPISIPTYADIIAAVEAFWIIHDDAEEYPCAGAIDIQSLIRAMSQTP